MKIIDTTIADIKILKPRVFEDERGSFYEIYRSSWFRENIANVIFVQDNYCSSTQGVLRGLHYQIIKPQAKLVWVVSGEVFDVVVDMRRNSPSFGQCFGTLLSAQNKQMLWVPIGFAHGYYVTSKTAGVVYKCSEYYAPEYERTLQWNDPELMIEWPVELEANLTLSNKDRIGIPFSKAEYF